MKTLTDRQLEVVKFIHDGQKEGNTPTLWELAEKLNVSSRQTVKDLLDAIAKKGYLVREPGRPRAIMLKPEAIREVKGNEFFTGVQLSLALHLNQNPNAFQWNNPTNIVINQGELSNNLSQTLVDSSSSIPLVGPDAPVIEEYLRFQMVAEKSNFDKLHNSTREFLNKTYQPLVVTPVVPGIGSETGYAFIEGDSQYQILWSGVNSDHYYYLGKGYGSTTGLYIMDGQTGQMKLFSYTTDFTGVGQAISSFERKLKSWSHYVDFPIYGAVLKKSGDIIFWSRKTDRDVRDLRYLFLVDITGTSIISRDKVLSRDISYNFPKSVNSST